MFYDNFTKISINISNSRITIKNNLLKQIIRWSKKFTKTTFFMAMLVYINLNVVVIDVMLVEQG